MSDNYKVRPTKESTIHVGVYDVVKITTIYGKRTSAYDSDPDEDFETIVHSGSLSECDAYIRLIVNGHLELN